MSFDAKETSEYSGEPLELFFFKNGDVSSHRQTSADRDIVIAASGVTNADGTYTATSIKAGAVEQSRDLAATYLKLEAALDNPIVLLYGANPPERKVEVYIFLKHESDAELLAGWTGEVKSVIRHEARAEIVCEINLQRMKRLGLRWFWQPLCNKVPYSTSCGVDKEDFRTDVATPTVSGAKLHSATIASAGAALPAYQADWFVTGYAERVDGSSNVVERRDIIAQNNADTPSASVTLDRPFSSSVAAETIRLYAGDKRTHEVCRDKFENIANGLMFFTIPGRSNNPFKLGFRKGETES